MQDSSSHHLHTRSHERHVCRCFTTSHIVLLLPVACSRCAEKQPCDHITHYLIEFTRPKKKLYPVKGASKKQRAARTQGDVPAIIYLFGGLG